MSHVSSQRKLLSNPNKELDGQHQICKYVLNRLPSLPEEKDRRRWVKRFLVSSRSERRSADADNEEPSKSERWLN